MATTLLSSIFGASFKESAPSGDSLFDNTKYVAAEKPKPVVAADNNDKDDEAPVAKKRKSRSRNKKRKAEEGAEAAVDPAPVETTEENAEKDTPNKDDDARTIFVGNLPVDCDRRRLKQLFASIGPIASTRLRSVAVQGIKLPPNQAGNQKLMKRVCATAQSGALIDAQTKDSIVGYVVFVDAASVPKAIQSMNNALIEPGRKLRVDTATPNYDPARSVFIGNLPYGIAETELHQHVERVCGFGSSKSSKKKGKKNNNDEDGDIVEGVRVVRDPETFVGKGFGYVLFRDRTSVATALQRLPNSVLQKRTLRVQVCGKRTKRSKKANKNTHTTTAEGTIDKRYKPTDETTNAREEVRPAKRPRSDPEQKQHPPPSNVLRRLLARSDKQKLQTSKKKRMRGEKKNTNPAHKKNSNANNNHLSKRAALEAKVDKRVKKLEKRAARGMGKAKK